MDKRLIGVFFYFREMAFKVFGDDLAKRLLGARAESAPRSLLARNPNTKESFGQTQNPKNSNFKSAFWA